MPPIPTLSTRAIVLLLPVLLGLLLGAGCRQPAVGDVSTVKIAVAEDGIYALTSSQLRQAGLSIEQLDPHTLRLSHDGQTIPLLVHNDTLLFHGQASDSRYTAHRTYLLETEAEGSIIGAAEAPLTAGPQLEQIPRRVHLERNHEYLSDARVEDSQEPWFWQSIPLQGALPIEMVLSHVADGSGKIEVRLYGATHNPQVDPDHTLNVSVNGQPVGTVSWDGQTAHTGTVMLPAGTLRTGENTISLENAPEDFLDLMKLDWIRVTYQSEPSTSDDRFELSGVTGRAVLHGFSAEPLIFDVTAPDAPLLLEDWNYSGETAHIDLHEARRVIAVGPEGYHQPASITPSRQSDWKADDLGADLIIISTEQLAPALDELVEARQNQGLRAAVVPVEDIYDEFGFGQPTPESINRFISHAHEHWQAPAPRYLLLVGDSSIDYRGYMADRPENPISPPDNVVPPYLVQVSFGGETVSDARLADVDGDYRPDLAVGRWPVDSVQQVRALVARTLAYEEATIPQRAIFAADGTSNEFANLTSRLLENAGFQDDTAQVLNGPTSAELTELWTDGSWLVTYTGHGSLELWGKDDVFSIDAVENLATSQAAPIVVQLTCLSGLFAHPEIESLSEAMLVQENGPVLIIGATSLTLSIHQEPFAVNLLEALRGNAPETRYERIGDALLHAKQSLDTERAGLREISDTFGLFGDPSTVIRRPGEAS
ncbi:MAG TPA: C25 family cysteine peptidase [Candidatus Sulfomarinibacteraceae bacterium]|nr:C25 family cysteine peptidase [Candidatus Sulfomarinibacteraceae bacterium]